MNASDKEKRINTVPKGVWESSIINEKDKHSKKEHLNDITTDMQGNGYPILRKNQND